MRLFIAALIAVAATSASLAVLGIGMATTAAAQVTDGDARASAYGV